MKFCKGCQQYKEVSEFYKRGNENGKLARYCDSCRKSGQDAKDKICGIYMILNEVTWKVYIGSSRQINKRFKQHKRNLRGNTHHSPKLQNSWNKYGENTFIFDILEECSPDDLVKSEQSHIDIFTSYDNDFGFNIQRVAYKHYDNLLLDPIEYSARRSAQVKKRYESEEERRKTGEATRLGQSDPEVKKKLSENGKKRWAREEEKQKQCERMKAFCSTDENRKRASEHMIKQYSDPAVRQAQKMRIPHRKRVQLAETGQIFESINEASKILGVSVVTIRDGANGKRKTKNFTFRWVVDE